MGQLGDLYAEGRDRFIELVADADPDTPVPTCPLWTVRDVLSHTTGICADILSGNIEGVATDPWTAAQVEARGDRSIGEISAEWQETGPQIDAMVDQFGRTGEQLLLDLTTHECDVRHALGRPGPKDIPVWTIAVDFVVTVFLDGAVRERSLAPLDVHCGGRTHRAGDEGEPGAAVTGAPFELVRAFTGRRTAAQVAALAWTGNSAPYIAAIESGPFHFAATEITE